MRRRNDSDGKTTKLSSQTFSTSHGLSPWATRRGGFGVLRASKNLYKCLSPPWQEPLSWLTLDVIIRHNSKSGFVKGCELMSMTNASVRMLTSAPIMTHLCKSRVGGDRGSTWENNQGRMMLGENNFQGLYCLITGASKKGSLVQGL